MDGQIVYCLLITSSYRASCFSNRKSINCVGSYLSFYCPGTKQLGTEVCLVEFVHLSGLCWTNTEQTDSRGGSTVINHQPVSNRRKLVTVQTIGAFMNKVCAAKVSSGGKMNFLSHEN